jgi:leader peptidase (prepilin peptidase)/N-methyltransferase
VPLPLLAGAGFIAGAIVGSFLATILVRWPAGRSVVSGRSQCDGCGTALGAAELVPILSFLVVRGRCRRCGAGIDKRHMLIELAAGLIGLVALLAHSLPLAIATMVFGLFLLILGPPSDAEHQVASGRADPSSAHRSGCWRADRLGDRRCWIVRSALSRAPDCLWGFGVAFPGGCAVVRASSGGDPKLLAGIGAWWRSALPMVLLGAGLFGPGRGCVDARRVARVFAAITRLPPGR